MTAAPSGVISAAARGAGRTALQQPRAQLSPAGMGGLGTSPDLPAAATDCPAVGAPATFEIRNACTSCPAAALELNHASRRDMAKLPSLDALAQLTRQEVLLRQRTCTAGTRRAMFWWTDAKLASLLCL